MSTENPFGGGKKRRPKYVPQRGSADFAYICREAGLASEQYATQEYLLARGGMSALYELFSDGEVIVQRADTPLLVGVRRDPNIVYGDFYSKLAQLRRNADTVPGSPLDNEMNKLARFCGLTLAEEVANGLTLPQASEVQAGIDEREIPYIHYADMRLPLRPGAAVMDVGPGVAGRQFIDLQANLIRRGNIIQYLPITRGPFVSEFLVQYGHKSFAQNPVLLDREQISFGNLVGQFFINREDGVPAAFEEIVQTPGFEDMNGFVDVMIWNGLGDANREEIAEGLTYVPRIVKPGGIMLLGSPIEKSRTDGMSFGEQLELVADDFTVVHQKSRLSGNLFFGNTTQSSFAILQRNAK